MGGRAGGWGGAWIDIDSCMECGQFCWLLRVAVGAVGSGPLLCHPAHCRPAHCRPAHCRPLPPALPPFPTLLLPAGKTWIDTYGDYTLLNTTTGAKAYMYFQPCGWFGSGRYQVGLPARGGAGSGQWGVPRSAVAGLGAAARCGRGVACCGGGGMVPCGALGAVCRPSELTYLPAPAPNAMRVPGLPAHASQISGTISREDGTPVYKLEGKWNEYLNAGGRGWLGGWVGGWVWLVAG